MCVFVLIAKPRVEPALGVGMLLLLGRLQAGEGAGSEQGVQLFVLSRLCHGVLGGRVQLQLTS